MLVLHCEQQDHKETQQEQGKLNGTLSGWAGNRIGDEGARVLGDALKTNTTLTQLELNSEQQDHKETLKESKASTMACEVAGQPT